MSAEPVSERQIARVTVTADRDVLPAVRAFLRELAAPLGLSPASLDRLAQSVDAVAGNVIDRGFAPGQAASLDVVFLRRPGQFVVAVEDRGRPFDFATLESGDAPQISNEAGRLRFLNLGSRGNRVEIAEPLPFPDIAAYIDTGRAAAVPAQPSEPSTAPVTLRLMTPDDAIAVARCTYSVYGYTLPDEYLYYPDRLREMLEGGLLEVVVGTTPDGEVVCYLTCEVEHAGAPVGYMEEGLVDPRFRHHGLLEDMLRFMQGRATERGMLGLYGEAVTVHPYSQKSNLALGFTETGVQLGDEAAAVDFKGIESEAVKARSATIINFLKLDPARSRTVYPPAHHRAMIERVYERGAFRREVREAPAAGDPARAEVRVDVSPEWSEASIRVIAFGDDLPDVVRFHLRELCLKRIDWICVDLPLSDPGAGRWCAAIEALGFFFAGVIPDLIGDDVLRLQFLNEVEADVASAQLASAFGKELFDYVVRAMQGPAPTT